jgi:hypothetical protein
MNYSTAMKIRQKDAEEFMEVLLEIFEVLCDEETTLSVAVCDWEYGIGGAWSAR